jgi:hypothetical protein
MSSVVPSFDEIVARERSAIAASRPAARPAQGRYEEWKPTGRVAPATAQAAAARPDTSTANTTVALTPFKLFANKKGKPSTPGTPGTQRGSETASQATGEGATEDTGIVSSATGDVDPKVVRVKRKAFNLDYARFAFLCL